MNKSQKKICVIGLGYIGLPTAALLASKNFNVLGVDVNTKVVDIINTGQIHIVEPDLHELVRSSVESGKLKASLKPINSEVYIICVPTPFYDEDPPRPNIEFIKSATKSIALYVKPGDLIILESTSPVGTTKKIEDLLIQEGVETKDINFAYCPERVLPGNIIKELIDNDRIVGGLDEASTEAAFLFYKSFVSGKILKTEAKTAEMCKLAENSFRDVNIAFANELSLICYKNGVDVWELIKLANHHPRVNILQPGTGVGGHCIAVDPWFLVSSDPKNSKLIKTAREVNNYKPRWIIENIINQAHEFTNQYNREPLIACLGLSFKPDIDDLRESPALRVAEDLVESGIDLIVVEPNIKSHASLNLVNIDFAIENADLICLLVKHKEFIDLNEKINQKNKPFLDFCGVFK